MTISAKTLGRLGEKIAQDYLKRKGYQILDRNYSPKFISGTQRGEIDIVAKKEKTITFFEVKTLKLNVPVFLPEEKVNYFKQRKLRRIAESWMMEKKIPLDSKWQIDIISIKIDLASKKAKIRHFKNSVFE